MAKLDRMIADWNWCPTTLLDEIARLGEWEKPRQHAQYKSGRGLGIFCLDDVELKLHRWRKRPEDKLVLVCRETTDQPHYGWRVGVLSKLGEITVGSDKRHAIGMPLSHGIIRANFGIVSKAPSSGKERLSMLHTTGLDQQQGYDFVPHRLEMNRQLGPINEQRLLRDLGDKATKVVVIGNPPA